MLSIVIPTLNEEKYLPLLLKCIKGQSFKDYEIIVADAGSEDGTIKIARHYNCKITCGGSPPKGRNEGAKIARGALILFLDADTVLPDNFLKVILKEFEERKLDVASFLLSSKEKFHNISLKMLYNFPSLICETILPQAMNVILIKRSLHERINGFNEKIKLGEELDYVRKASKLGRFGVLRKEKIVFCPRRFKRNGWFRTWLRYLLCQIHILLLGPVKSNIFNYRYGHYNETD